MYQRSTQIYIGNTYLKHDFHHSDIWLYLLLCHKFVLSKKLPVPIGSTLGHIVLPLFDF